MAGTSTVLKLLVNGATHEVVRRAIADGTLVRRASAMAIAIALACICPEVGAQPLDAEADNGVLDPPAPPTLPDLAHPELKLSYQYTGASIELNSPEGLEGRLCLLDGRVSYCTWGNLVADEAFYDQLRSKYTLLFEEADEPGGTIAAED